MIDDEPLRCLAHDFNRSSLAGVVPEYVGPAAAGSPVEAGGSLLSDFVYPLPTRLAESSETSCLAFWMAWILAFAVSISRLMMVEAS